MYFLAGQGTVGVDEASLDVLWLENGIVPENRLGRIPRRQLGQHMLHGKSHASDDWLAAEDAGANGDTVEQFRFFSHVFLHHVYWSGLLVGSRPVGGNLTNGSMPRQAQSL